MSYLKNMKRMGKDPVNRLLGKSDAAAITGTGADLRKLHNNEAGKLLKEKFQVDQETIDKLDRWERIGVLRHLSTEALAKGVAPEVCSIPPVLLRMHCCDAYRATPEHRPGQELLQASPGWHQVCVKYVRPPMLTVVAAMQGLGHMFARNVKVSMEEMRHKQFEAATIILRRQLAFLRTGTLPTPNEHEASVAPIGKLDERLDEQSMAIRTITPRDGDCDEPGAHGQLRLRRTVTYKVGGGRTTTRSMLITNRDDIFALNGLCEKWVRLRVPARYLARRVARLGRPVRMPLNAATRADSVLVARRAPAAGEQQ
jgi:hypothetical protein